MFERRLLKLVGILQRRVDAERVPLHVELGGGQQFGQHVSLVEGLGLFDLRDQFGGHGRAGLVVLGVVRKHRRIAGPVLVELRWEFDKIARHRCPGEAGILGVGEHAVQRVTELVEHGGHVGNR